MTGTARVASSLTRRTTTTATPSLAGWLSPMPDNPYEHADDAQVVDVPRLADYCGRCGKLDKEGAHARYYCPLCHEVTCGMKRQGEWIVLPHYRNGPKGKMDRIPCIGGPIDPREDRAP